MGHFTCPLGVCSHLGALLCYLAYMACHIGKSGKYLAVLLFQVTPFDAPCTTRVCTGGGCAGTRSTNASPTPQQAFNVVLGLLVLRLVLGLLKALMLVV